MSRDPIIDEVRQVRQRILAECGDDLDKLLDRLGAAETMDRGRVVTTKPQPKPQPDRSPAASK